jgi:AbrB family looped-hinge helix DNA binding protein
LISLSRGVQYELPQEEIIMETATVSADGQVTIPKSVRHALGLAQGGQVKFVEYGNGWFAMVAIASAAADLKGMGHRAGVHFTIEEMNDIVAHKVAAAEK